MKLLAALLALMISLVTIVPANAAELVMFEEAGCSWCERWNNEIGVSYAKTDEGKQAPLRRVDLEMPSPADLAHIKSVTFSPTFVVMDEGRELGRIIGYPGQDFFWPMLQEILSRVPDDKTAEATAANLRIN